MLTDERPTRLARSATPNQVNLRGATCNKQYRIMSNANNTAHTVTSGYTQKW